MKSSLAFASVYLHRSPVGFRKAIDGLSAIVQAEMKLDPFGSNLFVYVNRRKDKIKCLYRDRTGHALWLKRLDVDRFKWPKNAAQSVVTLSAQEFNWLLDGYDLSKMRPHSTLQYASSF